MLYQVPKVARISRYLVRISPKMNGSQEHSAVIYQSPDLNFWIWSMASRTVPLYITVGIGTDKKGQWGEGNQWTAISELIARVGTWWVWCTLLGVIKSGSSEGQYPGRYSKFNIHTHISLKSRAAGLLINYSLTGGLNATYVPGMCAWLPAALIMRWCTDIPKFGLGGKVTCTVCSHALCRSRIPPPYWGKSAVWLFPQYGIVL